MDNNSMISTDSNTSKGGRMWTGVFLVLVGAILLASKMGAPIPGWLLSWQFFLIGLGVLIGLRHKFRNPAWIILILIGSSSLIDDFYPEWNLKKFIWPAAIIVLGLFFILRPKRSASSRGGLFGRWDAPDEPNAGGFQPVHENALVSSEEAIDVTAVFGGVKKRLISKTFRGGDVTAFMGGVEIDLTGADINGTALLDVSAVFGGIKLIVPADWKVQNRATAVFGGVEDKRNIPASQSDKLLVIDGVAVFGGIELKSY